MTESKEILCIIPARGGSKGIRNKNLVQLEGKPLLSWSIEGAIAAECIQRVLVCTDSEEIAETARSWGAEVPYIRPADLSGDDVHAVQVVLHALDWLARQEGYLPEAVMMLLPTSPLRLTTDIERAVDLLRSKRARSVVSVVNLGKHMTNLRYIEDDLLVRVVPDTNPNEQRQGQKQLFAVNGSIYLARPGVLQEAGTFHIDGAQPFVMDSVNSVDINCWDELELARKFAAELEPWKSKETGRESLNEG
jgi:N-acylneuraminate cytidylyltransferase/CMP-N,N'-diacetyllegionaminic acid synthase